MKKALLLLLTLTIAAVSFAADNKPIEAVFNKYWEAYARKDFVKAAAEILPSDLDEAKSELLPIFLGAQTHKKKEAQDVVALFFGRAVGKARESLSPAEVYAGLNRVVTANNPDFFELLKEAKTSIVFIRTPDDDNAEVHFQVTIRAESDMDSENLTKKNGRWWLRINEDPKQVAAQLKAMFAQGI
ncbi:MAG: hypothetical protein V4773_28490 [Verrucomicrobiota bacterium]